MAMAMTVGRDASSSNDVMALKRMVAFYEDCVRRLSDEVARYQARSGPLSGTGGGATGLGGSFLEGTAEGDPLPPWLSDPQYLSPLLLAYDERLAEKDRHLQALHDELGDLRGRCQTLVKENAELSAEFAAHTEQISRQTDTDGASQPTENGRDVLQRVELLTKENDLLLEQQQELERGLTNLRTELRASTTECDSLGGQVTELKMRAEREEDRVEQLERRLKDSQKDARRLSNEKKALEEHLARTRTQLRSVEDAADTQKRELEQAQGQLQLELSSVRQQAQAMQLREREGAAATLTLTRDLETAREQAAIATRELHKAREEVAELRQLASTLDRQLTEYKLKDTTAFQRVKDATEKMEASRAEKERAQARLQHVEDELASATSRWQTQRQEWKSRADAELAGQRARFEATVSALRADVRALEGKSAELRSSLDRALREKNGLEVEAERARTTAALHAAQAAAAEPGSIHMAASFAARIEEAEQARDEALEKATSLSFAAQRSLQEWEREKNAMLAQAAELGRLLQKADAELEERQLLCAKLQATCDEREKIYRLLKRKQVQAERERQNQLESIRIEHEGQVRVLQSKLAEAVGLYQRSAADAEAILSAKEDLLRRWKEESKRAADSFGGASEEQRAEIGRLTARVENLTNRLELVSASHAALETEAASAVEALRELRPAHETAERKASEASAQVAMLLEAEQELIKAKLELRGQVDALSLEWKMADRQRAAALARCKHVEERLRACEQHSLKATLAYDMEAERRGREAEDLEERLRGSPGRPIGRDEVGSPHAHPHAMSLSGYEGVPLERRASPEAAVLA